MHIPPEFHQLAIAFYPGSRDEVGDPSLEAWIEWVVREFGVDKDKQVIMAFLNELLDGEHDDDEIQLVWDRTSPSVQFSPPRGTRLFLELVRERIAR